MIEKIKKIGIVVTIAVLFAIFVFSLTNAVYPKPKYEDFCDVSVRMPQPVEPFKKDCKTIPQVENCKGVVEYVYDEEGCPKEAKCNNCYIGYDLALEKYNFVLFIVSSIVGVIAILFGLFYNKREEFWNLVKGGFLLGGLISLFIGTGIYYNDMARFLRPVVILIELFIVIFVSYKMKQRK